jgi:hypothetical protein
MLLLFINIIRLNIILLILLKIIQYILIIVGKDWKYCNFGNIKELGRMLVVLEGIFNIWGILEDCNKCMHLGCLKMYLKVHYRMDYMV